MIFDLILSATIGICFFILLYFFLIRPQMQRLQGHRRFISSLKVGDSVVTQGGIVGRIVKIQDQRYLFLEISEGVVVKVKSDLISEFEDNSTLQCLNFPK